MWINVGIGLSAALALFQACLYVAVGGGMNLTNAVLWTVTTCALLRSKDLRSRLQSLRRDQEAALRAFVAYLERPDPPPEFVCPRCGKASWNRNDAAYGYCGACHSCTAPPGDLTRFAL